MNLIKGIDHFTVLSPDVEKTLAFYRNVLGLEPGYRPPFNSTGLWLYAGLQPLLHVMGGDPKVGKSSAIDHVSLSATGLKGAIASLSQASIEHQLKREPGTGKWQLFFEDCNGARLELDFDASELY